MKNIFIARAIFLALFFTLTLSNCGESAKKDQELANIHLRQAHAYYDNGQFRAAMIEARNVVQRAPESIDGYIITAKILNSLGQFKQSIDLLTSIDKTTATNAEYAQLLTEAYIGKGKHHSALKTLEQAVQLRQEQPNQYQLLLAECYRELGQTDKAGKIYQNSISQSPKNVKALIGMALTQLYNKNTVAAENTLAVAAEIEPSNYQIDFIHAQIKIASNDYAAAESLLTNTLFKLQDTDSMTPEKSSTLGLLADVLVKQGRTAEAMIYTQKLADAFPGYDLAMQSYQQAELLVKEGKLQQAEDELQHLLSDNPGFEKASTLIAIIKYMKGDYASASSLLNDNLDPEIANSELTKIAALSNLKNDNTTAVISLLENHPNLNNDTNLLAIYGRALLAENHNDKSLDALNQAIALDNKNVPALLSLASYYNKTQEPQKALQYIEQAYAADPKNHLVSVALIRQYATVGNEEKAEQHVNAQIKVRNSDSVSLELAGDFYTFQKNINKALNFYQKALNTESTNYRAALKIAHAFQLLKSTDKKIYAAYNTAISINSENPISFEYMLNYARHSDNSTNGFAAVDHAIKSNDSLIGNAVAAIFFSSLKQIEKAETYRQQLNEHNVESNILNSVDEALFSAKAMAALENNNISLAREFAHTGLKSAPQSLPLMKIITDIEFSEKNFREAEKIIAQVTAVNQALGLQLSGDLNQLKKNPMTALTSYQSAWRITPEDNLGSKIYHLIPATDASARSTFMAEWSRKIPNSLSIIEIQSHELLIDGNYQQAIILMEQLRKERPTNATNLNNLAWSYLQVSDQRALTIGKQAYEAAPKNPAIIDTYAWILFKNNMHEQAKAIIKQAVTLAPENLEIRQHSELINKPL